MTHKFTAMNWQWHEAPHLSRAIAFSRETILKEGLVWNGSGIKDGSVLVIQASRRIADTPLRLASKAYRCYRHIKGHISALLARAWDLLSDYRDATIAAIVRGNLEVRIAYDGT